MKWLLTICLLLTVMAPLQAKQPKPVWFNTLVAHWTDYTTPAYLKFLHDAKPEVAQVGFYGLSYYSLAHSSLIKGYMTFMPVEGFDETQRWLREFNAKVHKEKVKVVGHFNVEFIFGDLEKNTGFFKWYNEQWDEKKFGPKPCKDPREMMQVDAAGKPFVTNGYNIGGMPEYWACLNNPKWRTVLKSMMKVAIENGVDGLVANYFYRKDCMCAHCREGFRQYLATHYTAEALRTQMGIDDIRTYQFTEIPSWHDPAKTTPYRMAALTWTQIALKQDFDDIFIQYGKKLKPDLIVGQWNHLGDFGQIAGDERCCLPGDLWGKGEDYLWYSTGGAACFTDLANDFLGDGTLQLRYIRGAFGNHPYLLGKYESTRMRASIAEGVANGGTGMGFYANYKDPIGYKGFVDYFGFLRTHRAYYRGADPAGELLLLYPRSAVHHGDIAPVARFRTLGKRLIREHYAFDVLPDDLLTAARLRPYRAVAYCDEQSLSPAARQALDKFSGPRLLMNTAELPADCAGWKKAQLSAITTLEGSSTVILSLMAQPSAKRLMVHLVNYKREEPAIAKSPGSGPKDEKPIAVEKQIVHLQIPRGKRVKDIRVLSPDPETPAANLTFTRTGDIVTFTVPKVLVYTVAVVRFR